LSGAILAFTKRIIFFQQEDLMRLLCTLLVSLTVLGLSSGFALADEIVSFKAGYLVLSPEGTFAVDSGSIGGTHIDLENDLGYDDSEEFFGEVALQLGPFRLAGSYTPIKFSGDGSFSQPVNFNGQTFAANLATASDVDLKLYDVGLTWHIINFDDLPVRLQLGPEIAVKYLDADLSLDGVESGSGLRISESESYSAPFPTIGARARVGIADYLALVGRVGYLGYKDNSFLDVDGQIEFSPLPLVGVFGGYRYMDIQVDESDVYIDAQFSGPYGGLLVRF
jgi:outer membrane protein